MQPKLNCSYLGFNFKKKKKKELNWKHVAKEQSYNIYGLKITVERPFGY